MTKEEKIAMLQKELEDLQNSEEVIEHNEEVIEHVDEVLDEEIQDAEFTEAPQEDPEVVTMIHLGYRKDGSLIFSVEGEANLLAIEGLLKYADREMKKVWEQKPSDNHVGEKKHESN
jgi:hypothetical protein